MSSEEMAATDLLSALSGCWHRRRLFRAEYAVLRLYDQQLEGAMADRLLHAKLIDQINAAGLIALGFCPAEPVPETDGSGVGKRVYRKYAVAIERIPWHLLVSGPTGPQGAEPCS